MFNVCTHRYIQEYKSALQYLYGLSTYFEDLWVLLILVIACPFNPIQFDTNELNNIRLFLEAIPNSDNAIHALNKQWIQDTVMENTDMEVEDEFSQIKISILDLFGQYEQARLIAE